MPVVGINKSVFKVQSGISSLLQYPELKNNIKGEEDSTFTNSAGEKVTVQVYESVDETTECLTKVLNGNIDVAHVLAEEVHKTVNYDLDLAELYLDLNLENVGVIVDPIDATAEYIKAVHKDTRFNIPSNGLKCVTILIGLYDTITGVPVIGVINQPFYEEVDQAYKSKIFWGISVGDVKLTNVEPPSQERNHKIAVLSSSEQTKFTKFLKQKLKYEICYSSGAGHKILKLITGEADLNLLSRSTTFKWDTCAGQAILMAMGGNVLSLNDTIFTGKPVPLLYSSNEPNVNMNGILAYRDEETINAIIAMFLAK